MDLSRAFAGLSTAAGIADYRGPRGVWTLLDKGAPMPDCVPLETIRPTAGHMVRSLCTANSTQQSDWMTARDSTVSDVSYALLAGAARACGSWVYQARCIPECRRVALALWHYQGSPLGNSRQLVGGFTNGIWHLT